MKTVSGFLIVCLAPALCAQTRPPTIDPTYGFPVPKPVSAPKKLPLDAKWIWSDAGSAVIGGSQTETFTFSRSFSLREAPSKAAAYVTADNFFVLFVNGKKIGMTTPEPNNDFVWDTARRYDIASALTAGTNTIRIEAVNAGGPGGVLARFEINGAPALFTDKTWKVEGTNHNAVELGDAGMDPWGGRLKGWPVPIRLEPDYLRHLTMFAVGYSDVKDPTAFSGLESVKKGSTARIRINRRGTGETSFVLDFGQELTGRVKVTADKDARITIGTGESREEAINKPWTNTQVSLRAAEPAFTPYTAMRFAKISFETSARFTFTFDHLYYPVEYKGRFECSDPLLTRIWYMGANTVHLCMQEDIWDAPKRDRMRWMGDLHVEAEVINNVFFDKFLLEQTMQRLRSDAQGPKPPNQLPNSHVNGIPGYSCAWLCGLADFHRHVGDFEYLKKQHELILSMLEYFEGEMDANGLFANKRGQWPFVDWAPEFNGDTPFARMATHLFFTKAVKEAAFLLAELGDNQNAAKYRNLAADLTRCAQQNFADANGVFGDRRQSNAMAIYSGVANDEQKAAIWNAVLNPNSKAWEIQATPYYNNYVIFAMSMAGHTQEAVDFIRKYWGGMLAQGATSWWEGYDPKWPKEDFHRHLNADNDNGYFVSLSHGWSSGPTSFLTERVLGVRPVAGGFREAVIEPDLGDLSFAEGDVPTPFGLLKVRAEKQSDGMKIVCTVPSGMTAQIANQTRECVLDGKTVQSAKPKLGPGRHVVILRT